MSSQTLPIDDGARRPSVDELIAEYFAACEIGDTDMWPYLTRLGSDPERRRFESLVSAARVALATTGHPLTPGAILNERYRLDRKIGHGGMGEVWSAWDNHVECDVAIKTLTGGLDPRQSANAIRSEIKLMNAVKHRGIATVRDLQIDNSLTYFVMDLVEGITLTELIDRVHALGKKPPAREIDGLLGLENPNGEDSILRDEDWHVSVARITAEVLRILEAAHARGIVHRDLKPGNIMLRGGGHPVLLDFGLGLPVEAHETTTSLFGTAHYIAPERLSGDHGADPKQSDVYQLGVILYELLTLRHAIHGESPAQILSNVLESEIDPPQRIDAAIPEPLQSVCMKALAKNPRHRYPTARAFRAGLEDFLERSESAPLQSAAEKALKRLGDPFVPARYQVRAELLRNEQLVRLLAIDTIPNKEVVLEYPGAEARQILRSMAAHDRNKILREARIRAQIEHPSVQRLLSVIDAEFPILVLEARTGEALSELLRRRGRLEPEEVRALGIRIADALFAVHRCEVVHRAISADNILVDGDVSQAILTGFVFSKPIDLLGGSSIMCSDRVEKSLALPAHIAPEQLRGEPAEPRSDVYALGCVLYRCMSGHAAFADDEIGWTEPEPPRDVPRDLAEVVLKCMRGAKTARYATMADVKAALERVDTSPPARRGPIIVAVTATIVAIALAIAWWASS